MSITFTELTHEALPLLKQHIASLQNGDCNLSLASLIGRAREYKVKYAMLDEHLILQWQPYKEVPPSYVIPVFSDELESLVTKLEAGRNRCTDPLLLFGRFTKLADRLNEVMPYRNFLSVSSNAWWDYLYSRENLVNLEGPRLHGKRNFIKRFWKAYPDATFKRLDQSLIQTCRTFLNEWYASQEQMTDSLKAEAAAIGYAFDHYDELELIGGALVNGDEVFGFSYGSAVYEDIFAVHIEKARRDVTGAYPVLATELAKIVPEQFAFLNREEDLGLAGLRKAKSDWHPCGVIRKTVFKMIEQGCQIIG